MKPEGEHLDQYGQVGRRYGAKAAQVGYVAKDNAPAAFMGLFTGANTGKMLVRL